MRAAALRAGPVWIRLAVVQHAVIYALLASLVLADLPAVDLKDAQQRASSGTQSNLERRLETLNVRVADVQRAVQEQHTRAQIVHRKLDDFKKGNEQVGLRIERLRGTLNNNFAQHWHHSVNINSTHLVSSQQQLQYLRHMEGQPPQEQAGCDPRDPWLSLRCTTAPSNELFFFHSVPELPAVLDGNCKPNKRYPFTTEMLRSKGLANEVGDGWLDNVQKVHQRLMSGSSPVSIVTIGGSMAAGTNCLRRMQKYAATPECAHGSVFSNWLKVKYPRACVRSTNKAVPGAHLGASLSKLPSFVKGADIIVVDFSVNDKYSNDPMIADEAESFLRFVMQTQPSTVVIWMHSVCTSTPENEVEQGAQHIPITLNGAEKAYTSVGQHYKMPYVSMPLLTGSVDKCNSVWLEGNPLTGRDTNDPSHHPPWNVHQLLGDLIANAWWTMVHSKRTQSTSTKLPLLNHLLLPPVLSNASKSLMCVPMANSDYDSSIQPRSLTTSLEPYKSGLRVTNGNWKLFEDRKGKPGWIATEPESTIEFDLSFSSPPSMTLMYLQGYEKLSPVSIGFRVNGKMSATFVLNPIRNADPATGRIEKTTISEIQTIPSFVLAKLGVLNREQATLVITLLKPAQKFKLLGVSTCEAGFMKETLTNCPWQSMGLPCNAH